MYHYVRDLGSSKYPRIKGMQTECFEEQIEYIRRKYTVMTFEELVAYVRGDLDAPTNACHLTFDDGFVDHYKIVMPRLVDRGLGASFYPSKAMLEGRVLDVHKIHFVLASCNDIKRMKRELLDELRTFADRYEIASERELIALHDRPGKYDDADTAFIKRLLQSVLPRELQLELLNGLFARYVTGDEKAFANELYLSLSQLREMAACGMGVGGHGYNHLRLGSSPDEIQELEIAHSKEMVELVCGGSTDWVMSYPYGDYDDRTISLLKRCGCIAGLTTRKGCVQDNARPMELERMNTNDIVPD